MPETILYVDHTSVELIFKNDISILYYYLTDLTLLSTQDWFLPESLGQNLVPCHFMFPDAIYYIHSFLAPCILKTNMACNLSSYFTSLLYVNYQFTHLWNKLWTNDEMDAYEAFRTGLCVSNQNVFHLLIYLIGGYLVGCCAEVTQLNQLLWVCVLRLYFLLLDYLSEHCYT